MKSQYLVSVAVVLGVALVCFFLADFFGYRVVALILLMTVSIIAMLFDILPVLAAAVLSAIIWNFLFIPPLFTFHIHNAEDVLMFLLYFLIALVNAVLTFKIRDAESKARDKEEKEHTIKLYNTLLNSLSHELRTPISTIVGAVDTLKENRDKLSVDQEGELLSEIDKATTRLNRQVENLLSMSRLESGMLKPKYDWCDMNELIHSVIQKLETSGTHKINFNVNDELPLLKLDEGLMEQVIHNILHNAIQYTPANSTIEMDVIYHENKCMITIADNGGGVPEDEIPQVFAKFHRLPDSKAGGSGLGLSIVKGFVEAHNGKVTLFNNTQGGATFCIEIPAEASFLNNLKNE